MDSLQVQKKNGVAEVQFPRDIWEELVKKALSKS